MRQAEGREVVIVEAVRTPIGRGHREKGYYSTSHPNALLGKVYTEVISRARHRARGRRGRHRRVRAAVWRAGVQHRPQRLAAGGFADRDARARPSIASAAPRSRPSTSPPR